MRPKILDLFCGDGGAGMGYHQAGFDVIGVDINPHPRYPFEFHQANAFDVLRAGGVGDWCLFEFAAIHASPPCQAYSVMRAKAKKDAPELVPPTQKALRKIEKPYVIENVPGAPLDNPVQICGSAFGMRIYWAQYEETLYLRRHRLFEANWPIKGTECRHPVGISALSVTGNQAFIPQSIRFKHKIPTTGFPRDLTAKLMEMPWTRDRGVSEAIPPSYTCYIGKQLRGHLH